MFGMAVLLNLVKCGLSCGQCYSWSIKPEGDEEGGAVRASIVLSAAGWHGAPAITRVAARARSVEERRGGVLRRL